MFSFINKPVFKRRAFVPLLAFGMVFLSGCASKSQSSNAAQNQQNVTLTQQEYASLKEMAQQWQQNKAGLARLLAYEQKLGALINDLSGLVANNNANKGQANKALADNKTSKNSTLVADKVTPIKRKPAEANLEPAPQKEVVISLFKADKPHTEAKRVVSIAKPVKATAQSAAQPTNSSQAKYAVQVASVKDTERAKQVFKALQKRLPNDQQAMADAQLESKKIGQAQFYRLKLGAYSTKQQAQLACEQWQQQNISCFVTQFGGLTGREWL